ncbi:MAG: tRNA (cytidine(34)-2'-O)-methyltransferase [Elusimicrobia bacterium]|nr:tRNA (cytidine(34)-2'-O)-methyltransferase [Elusimicrobiota bacterium]
MHIVLVEPEIHWNTGNIGRTCVATGTTLHLVGRLGFSLDDKEIRRAGLDYWSKLALMQHKSFDDFMRTLAADASILLFSTKAVKSFWAAPYHPDSYLVFGSEGHGLPESLLKRHEDRAYRIPIGDGVRSLNLSTAASVALYEGLRQTTKTPRTWC